MCNGGGLDLERLRKETEIVGYPILPLVRQLSSMWDEEAGRYVHLGATTQDIMDIASVPQMKTRLDIVERLLGDVRSWKELRILTGFRECEGAHEIGTFCYPWLLRSRTQPTPMRCRSEATAGCSPVRRDSKEGILGKSHSICADDNVQNWRCSFVNQNYLEVEVKHVCGKVGLSGLSHSVEAFLGKPLG